MSKSQSHSNIVDIQKHRKQSVSVSKVATVTSHSVNSEVVDITERRQEQISQERRSVRRTILTEFMGVFVILPQKGLQKVSMYDISDDGLSFDMEKSKGHFKNGEEVAMRLYLSQKNYFPFVAKVSNVREIDEDGVVRHGASFVKNTVNSEALTHFVKFLESVSLTLQKDNGDLLTADSHR
jgi:hypothetical protein